MSSEKPHKYTPGPNDPSLPPQLSEFKDKTTDEVLKELNRMPFFMTKLDDTDGQGGENLELEALKALAYEGEPHEIAENFKNQGNDLYKAKRFKDARDVYLKGIQIENNKDVKIKESLFANKAACELELKNFRRCINDCKNALQLNPKNVKCYFRMTRAFFALDKLEEAKESVEFGLKFDPENTSLINLHDTIIKKELQIKENELKILKEKKEKENLKIILENAIGLRHIMDIKTSVPPELIRDAKIKLDDPMDFESQLIYPAVIMYPTTNEFDFVAEVSELTTVQELLDLLMDRPKEWFQLEGHENFSSKKLIAYMETQSGGLIKAGKKLSFHDILVKDSPKVPIFYSALKIYLVPKAESETWLAKWDKTKALMRRSAD
ncbi:HSP70/90 family co-chaperone CNS1 NDAI_0C05290 [Naumovozyma dairenensis CBS 421]|uniref:Cns1/TTC4 wheel domain-containing protein n=1 Tax=Naumovozyma dairenensis (strain ATCC 10597 / BCRC 20456 / CBS 421 / NBRC 0211 / NRRL Y-12639) TaxID=1071378 RepID=G0W8S7_NAUDC|nr:hypothetical protein NDAI_0C05290 [Naumovozyma dairenensis CBS 421]CCD24188.1 hypothetical protein NDAI_0C05290 [Naumovozyma dairenensis CBS 421]